VPVSDLQPRRQQETACQGRLFLIFRIDGQRFALDTREVVEVLPRQPLKPIAHTPAWVAGVLAHRGALVPVIDVSALAFGKPAPARTSTRLVLVHYRADPQRPDLVLGLVLERASDTWRLDPAEFRPYEIDNRDAPYLGPVREDAHGLLQLITVQDLLGEQTRQMLFPSFGELAGEGA
jgi:chemotaxis-related protein WspB